MSRLALQRVMVRMFFDPDFATRVVADPAGALPNDMLTTEERAWLARPDARAWRADPDRPLRALAVLGQEYPSAAALAVASGGGAARVRRFFATDGFAKVVMERGSMAAAFGDFLAGLVEIGVVPARRVPPHARLAQTVVLLRRRNPGALDRTAPEPNGRGTALTPESPRFRLAAGKALHRAPAGTADLRDEIHDLLVRSGRELTQAIFEPGLPAPRTRVHASRTEPLLLEIVPDDGPRMKRPVGVAEITEELNTVLAYAAEPRTPAELAAEVERLGADPGEGEEIIAGLIEEGVLAAVDDPPGPPTPTGDVSPWPEP